jgi:hypothetical protein
MDGALGRQIRPMPKYAILTCALFTFVSLPCHANSAVFSDKTLSYSYVDCTSHKSSFTLPYFQSGDDRASARINNYMHVAVLDIAPPISYRTETLRVPVTNWISSSARDLKFRTFANNGGRIINVALSSDTCASRGGVEESVYSFDAMSGRLLVENELLTEAGRQRLSKSVFNSRRATIQGEIVRLNKRLASEKKQAGKDMLLKSLALYKRCLSDRFSKKNLRAVNADSLGMMVIGDKQVTFSVSECSTQADAASEEIGGLNNKISSTELRPSLTKYGLYILLGEGDGTIKTINSYAQFFSGRLNDADVTLYLGGENPWSTEPMTKAVYFDKKRPVLIPLSVENHGDSFLLTEAESKATIKPVFELRSQAGGLVGKWEGAGKTYVVTFTAL